MLNKIVRLFNIVFTEAKSTTKSCCSNSKKSEYGGQFAASPNPVCDLMKILGSISKYTQKKFCG